MGDPRFFLLYSFLLHIFYYEYLEILRLKNYFKKCAKSNGEVQKRTDGIDQIENIRKRLEVTNIDEKMKEKLFKKAQTHVSRQGIYQ